MADEEVVAVEEVPAEPEAPYVAAPGNCAGELVLLPAQAEGLTFNLYECQECHQIVHMGHEDLANNGLPPEHAKLGVE